MLNRSITNALVVWVGIPLLFGVEPRVARAQCDGDERAQLLPWDGTLNRHFGYAVAVDRNVVVVGDDRDEDASPGVGSAYVFRFNPGGPDGWVEEAKLLPSDTLPDYHFGRAVAVSGDVVLVGSPEDAGDGTPRRGLAYIFRHDGSTWVEEATLRPPGDGMDTEFGRAVALSGDVAVVGAYTQDSVADATGSAFVFRFDGSDWVREQELFPPDGERSDFFGWSVDIWNELIVVGAMYDDEWAVNSGSAFVFRYDGSAWEQEAKLVPSEGAYGDSFGFDVAISGDVAAVTLNNWYWRVYNDVSRVYIFRYDDNEWTEEAVLVAPHDDLVPGFAFSVAVSDNIVIIGSRCADYLADCSGAATVFAHEGAEWVHAAQLTASDGGAGDQFGVAMATSGARAIVGAWGYDTDEGIPGAVYIFEGIADCNTNSVIDLCDIVAGTSADYNDNGIPDECETLVALDIRPDSCPNPLNPRSHGVVSVALVGDDSFHIAQVDVDSLRLFRSDGVGGAVAPLMGPPGPGINVEDVATPFDGERCACHELQGDGIDDLVLKFSTSDLVETFNLNSPKAPSPMELVLRGLLNDSTAFQASDCVTLVVRGDSSSLRNLRPPR